MEKNIHDTEQSNLRQERDSFQPLASEPSHERLAQRGSVKRRTASKNFMDLLTVQLPTNVAAHRGLSRYPVPDGHATLVLTDAFESEPLIMPRNCNFISYKLVFSN